MKRKGHVVDFVILIIMMTPMGMSGPHGSILSDAHAGGLSSFFLSGLGSCQTKFSVSKKHVIVKIC